MAGDNKATVELILLTDQAIAAVRQYRAEAEAAGITPSGGGGGGTGLAAGGAGGGGGGSAPNLGAGQVASPGGGPQSKAAALAGTAAAANNDPHVGGSGGGASQGGAVVAKPENMLGAIGGMMAFNSAMTGLSHALGGYAQSQVSGSEWSKWDLVRPTSTVGLSAIGGLIGRSFGASGVGLAIGAAVSEVGNSILDPIIGAAKADTSLINFSGDFGFDPVVNARGETGYYKNVAERELAFRKAGRPTSQRALNRINEIDGEGARDVAHESYNRLRYSNRSIAFMGAEDRGSSMADVLKYGAGDDLTAAAQLARSMGMDATPYLRSQRSRARFSIFDPVNESFASLAFDKMQYGDEVGGFAKWSDARAKGLDDTAANEVDPHKAAILRTQSEMMRRQTARAIGDWETDRLGARSEYNMGVSGRNLENAIFSGRGEGAAASELVQTMRELAQATRENTEKRYASGQINQATYEREMNQSMEMDQEAVRTERANKQRQFTRGLAWVDYDISGKELAAMPRAMYGDIEQQSTDMLKVQQEGARSQSAYIRANAHLLSADDQVRALTQANRLDAQVIALGKQITMATIFARDTIRERDLYGETLDPARKLIEGAGGLEAGSALDIMVGIHKKQLAGLRKSRQETLQTHDPNSSEVIDYDNKIISKQMEIAQMEAGLGRIGMSGFDRANMANLSVQMQVAQSGYGSSGDIRQAAEGMAKILFKSIEELNQRESSLRGEGRLTGEAAADLATRRAGYAQQALQLQQMAENGWDQRLISDVYNAPGTGLMIMPHMNHREAANNGISNPAFGGRKAEMDAFRSMAQRFRTMLGQARGTGTPEGMASEGMSTAEKRRVDVEVNVTVNANDTKGRPLESSQRILQDARTVDQLIHNPHAKRPSG